MEHLRPSSRDGTRLYYVEKFCNGETKHNSVAVVLSPHLSESALSRQVIVTNKIQQPRGQSVLNAVEVQHFILAGSEL